MINQFWASRTLDGKTYHATRASGRTILCGLDLPKTAILFTEVPKRCRKCPRCVYKGA